ncbi:MAG TPA: hypothetical protein VNI60_03165, partial [Pyrinomonadaceae bacterium]|nr:hypothetical protein [Pyrinomonadaceae bacterium]
GKSAGAKQRKERFPIFEIASISFPYTNLKNINQYLLFFFRKKDGDFLQEYNLFLSNLNQSVIIKLLA